jgi:tetratricopeptide (TPR) repeat protein
VQKDEGRKAMSYKVMSHFGKFFLVVTCLGSGRCELVCTAKPVPLESNNQHIEPNDQQVGQQVGQQVEANHKLVDSDNQVSQSGLSLDSGLEFAGDQGSIADEATYNLYTQANYFHSKGNAQKTIQLYKQLFEKKPPIFVYDGYFRFLFDIGQIAKIVEIYQKNEAKFKKFFEKNLDFNLLVAQAFLMANKDENAESIFVQLAKDFPDNEQVAYYFAVSLIKNNQFEKSLAYVNECLSKQVFKSRYFLFYFLRSKVYMHMGKNSMAMSDIEKSLELFPNFDKALLLKAMLLEQLGLANEAIKGYQHFLALVGRDEMIEKQVIQLMFSQNRMPEALQYLKKLKGNSAEYFFDLAMIQFNSGDYKKALQDINTCIQKSPHLVRARLLKVEILLAMKDHNQVLSFMRDWLMSYSYDNSVIYTLTLLSKAGVSAKHVTGLLEDIVKANKATAGVWAALADIYVEQKNYKTAITLYKKIFDSVADSDLKSKVLYQVAYLYFLTNQNKNMENILLQSIKHPVVYPASYNLLAYSYAKNGKNLDAALDYANKALLDDANSPFYLDTKGLVLAKMGKKEQALELFEKALTLSPGDTVIIEHIEQAKLEQVSPVEQAKLEQVQPTGQVKLEQVKNGAF